MRESFLLFDTDTIRWSDYTVGVIFLVLKLIPYTQRDSPHKVLLSKLLPPSDSVGELTFSAVHTRHFTLINPLAHHTTQNDFLYDTLGEPPKMWSR